MNLKETNSSLGASPRVSKTGNDRRTEVIAERNPSSDSEEQTQSDIQTIPIDPVDADAILHGREFLAGQLVANRYKVIRLLGKGGMGAVYAVEDSEFDGETVALKTVLPELDHDGNALRRFKREVHLARRVTHANACRIFDVGYHQLPGGSEVLFVTMEYLDGETLSDRIRRVGPLAPSESFPLILQICAGLTAIHDAGIIHRDFKSSNVMVVGTNEKPRAVVTDFGLACLNAPETERASSITGTGTALGSPMYMAPEQVEGSKVTFLTDVYALGVVMFEMVTGRFPFEGDTALAVAVKRLREAPTSPRNFTTGLDPLWEAVILRCLERQPSERFENVAAVARALADAEGSARPAHTGRPTNDEVTTVLPSARTSAPAEQVTHHDGPKRVLRIGGGIAAILFLSIFGWYSLRQTKIAPESKTAASTAIKTKSLPTTTSPVGPSRTILTQNSSIGEVARPERVNAPNSPQSFEALRRILASGQSPWHVELHTRVGKDNFVEGERIEYDVKAESDGYLYLLVFSNGDVATCIFPNGADPDNEISEGTFEIPRNKNYEFPVQGPFGTDLHVAVLSKRKLSLGKRAVYSWEEAIKEIEGSRPDAASRGVGVRPTREWQAASILLRSKPR